MGRAQGSTAPRNRCCSGQKKPLATGCSRTQHHESLMEMLAYVCSLAVSIPALQLEPLTKLQPKKTKKKKRRTRLLRRLHVKNKMKRRVETDALLERALLFTFHFIAAQGRAKAAFPRQACREVTPYACALTDSSLHAWLTSPSSPFVSS